MIRGLTELLRAAAERHVRDFLIVAVTAAGAALFAAVGLGFATFAAYLRLSASEGRVVAALIIAAAFGLLAGLIWAIGVALRRAGRARGATASSAAASSANADPLSSSAAAAASKEQLALVAATQLGRELSPMQLLALALIGGFVAGRKQGK